MESDEHQTVEVNDDGIIEIDPADPEELYIPYYEPEEVTVYQRSRVYHYYPRAYPVYYYPYPSDYYFPYYFWGVTSVFSVGWNTHHLHLRHYGFNDHPYFGHHYYDPFYHRRPHLCFRRGSDSKRFGYLCMPRGTGLIGTRVWPR